MSLRRVRRPFPGRTRKGLRNTALAVTVVAALTASQAPGLTARVKDAHAAPPADEEHRPAADAPYAAPVPPGDGSYHTELPPLAARSGVVSPAVLRDTRTQSGIPATVLRAYRAAETSVGRTDPGCRLPWELLAAIGKVESGHAGGGAVGPDGTTTRRITGPALDGRGFALIGDTDGGSYDGDRRYDRAVGPMQFLPSTWARWGADGNGDGRADPDNVFDAALAAGHYLCAGDRDLGRDADLTEAVLGYNHSRAYLELVARWLEFYSGESTPYRTAPVCRREAPARAATHRRSSPPTARTVAARTVAGRETTAGTSSSARTRPRRPVPARPPPLPRRPLPRHPLPRPQAPPPRRHPRRLRSPPGRPAGSRRAARRRPPHRTRPNRARRPPSRPPASRIPPPRPPPPPRARRRARPS